MLLVQVQWVQVQHSGDFSDAFKATSLQFCIWQLVRNRIIRLRTPLFILNNGTFLDLLNKSVSFKIVLRLYLFNYCIFTMDANYSYAVYCVGFNLRKSSTSKICLV